MQINLTINVSERVVSFIRGVLRRRNVMIVTAVAVFGVAVATATPIEVPNTFTGGTVISSGQVNANFAALAEQSVVYTNPVTNGRYSLNAGFCGQTTALSTGNLGGYTGAKTQCETTCGTDTAHMCTSEEVIRYVSTGGTMPNEQLWIATGVGVEFLTDCLGWTSSSDTSQGGTFWTPDQPGLILCSASARVACCD
jgi:hypothetical protein